MRLLFTVLLAIVLSDATRGQTCLHGPDESARQRARVTAAMAFIRDVHEAQSRAYRERDTYVPLREAMSVAEVPTGFLPRLTAGRWSYAIIMKDGFDPCGFALVSDQDGVIYEASPSSRPIEQAALPQEVVEEER
jgi:hypothetical protein